jgi:hypothetical protein
MRFKIKEFKRDKFIVVNERDIPVLEDDEKSYIFDDIDDALNLRDNLNARIEEEMAKLS